MSISDAVDNNGLKAVFEGPRTAGVALECLKMNSNP